MRDGFVMFPNKDWELIVTQKDRYSLMTIYHALIYHCIETDLCFPSMRTLSKLTKLSTTTIQKGIRRLKEIGLIEISKLTDCSPYKSQGYRLISPALQAIKKWGVPLSDTGVSTTDTGVTLSDTHVTVSDTGYNTEQGKGVSVNNAEVCQPVTHKYIRDKTNILNKEVQVQEASPKKKKVPLSKDPITDELEMKIELSRIEKKLHTLDEEYPTLDTDRSFKDFKNYCLYGNNKAPFNPQGYSPHGLWSAFARWCNKDDKEKRNQKPKEQQYKDNKAWFEKYKERGMYELPLYPDRLFMPYKWYGDDYGKKKEKFCERIYGMASEEEIIKINKQMIKEGRHNEWEADWTKNERRKIGDDV